MDGKIFWRLVLVAVAAYFAIQLVLWALNTLGNILRIGVTLAVIVGIVWLLVQIFGRKKAFY
jgi:hypothetical protein